MKRECIRIYIYDHKHTKTHENTTSEPLRRRRRRRRREIYRYMYARLDEEGREQFMCVTRRTGPRLGHGIPKV